MSNQFHQLWAGRELKNILTVAMLYTWAYRDRMCICICTVDLLDYALRARFQIHATVLACKTSHALVSSAFQWLLMMQSLFIKQQSDSPPSRRDSFLLISSISSSSEQALSKWFLPSYFLSVFSFWASLGHDIPSFLFPQCLLLTSRPWARDTWLLIYIVSSP